MNGVSLTEIQVLAQFGVTLSVPADAIGLSVNFNIPEEVRERARVVDVARSWLLTPYSHAGRSKGAGTDCAMIIVEVFEEAGLVPHLTNGFPEADIPFYPLDWFVHHDEERYLPIVERFASKLVDSEQRPTPADGDIALYRFGRCVSHGAIVDRWPRVIHAWRRSGKVEYGEGNRGELGARFAGIWRLRRWTEAR